MIAQEGGFAMATAGSDRTDADVTGRRLMPGDVIHDLVDRVAEDDDREPRTRSDGSDHRLTDPDERLHAGGLSSAVDRRIYDLTVVVEEGPAILTDETALREVVIRRAEAIVGDMVREIVPAIADRLIREGFPAIAERMIREEIEKLKGEEEGMA